MGLAASALVSYRPAMSSITDSVVDEVRTVTKERLLGPVVGNFVVSWSIANWKFWIIVLFGDGGAGRLRELNQLWWNQAAWYGRLLVVPTATTAFAIWGLPYVNHWVIRFRVRVSQQFAAGISALQGQERLSVEESIRLRQENTNRREEVTALRLELTKRKTELDGYSKREPAFMFNRERVQEIHAKILKDLGSRKLAESQFLVAFELESKDEPALAAAIHMLLEKHHLEKTPDGDYRLTSRQPVTS